MPLVEDLDALFKVDELATTVIYSDVENALNHPESGQEVMVIFDNAYLQALLYEGSEPVITIPTNKFPGISHGARFTIQEVDYTVRGVQPDGTGISNIVLSVDS